MGGDRVAIVEDGEWVRGNLLFFFYFRACVRFFHYGMPCLFLIIGENSEAVLRLRYESTELYGFVGIRAEACRTLGLLPLFKEGGCPRPHEQTVNPGIQESVNMSLSGGKGQKK